MNREALPDPDDMFADTRMSMGDHIEELRRHLLKAIYGFALGMFLSFFIGHWVMTAVISRPVEEQLRLYWERYNEKNLGPLAERYATDKTLKMAPLKLDVHEIARRLGLRDEKGNHIKLTLVDRPLFVPADAFEKMLNGKLEVDGKEAKPLGLMIDRSQLGDDRWIYLEPEPREFVRAMQEFNLAAKPPTLAAMAPQEAFVVFIKVCMLTGLIISSPWVFFQIWSFVAAGLYPHEKRLVNVYMPYSIGLFLIGAFVCQFLVIPKAIAGLLWFNDWLGVQPDFRLNEWLGFAILMPLVFGISFQTPLVMLFAYTIGVIDVPGFRKFRGIAYFVIILFAALILPTPDLLSMMLLAGPMWLLYELGIFLCIMQPRSEFGDDSDGQEMIEV